MPNQILSRLAQLMNPTNIFNPPMGNDLPSQGGITGMMDPSSMMDPISTGTYPSMPGATSPTAGFEQSIPQSPMYGGGLDPNSPEASIPQFDMMGNPQTPNEDDFVRRRMAELYTPEHTASDQYNQMISKYPTRQKPGFMQKLTASLMGFGRDPQGAERALEGNFPDQLLDWKNQIGPMQQAANLERYMNANERSYANQETQRELQQQEITRKEKADEGKQKVAEGNLKVREARAATYDWKTRHPGSVIQTNDKGQLIGIDKMTNTSEIITDPDGNPVKSSHLTDIDKINLLQQGKMEQIGAQQTGANERAQITADTRGWSQPTIIDDPDNPGKKLVVSIHGATGEVKTAKIGGKPITEATKVPTAGSGAKGENETQQKVGKYNKAQQALIDHPEWSEWLHTNASNNEVKIDPPPTGISAFGYNITDADKNKVKNYQDMQKYMAGEPTGGKPDDVKRQRAVDQLKRDKQPVTEKNIQWMMEKL